MATMPEEEHDSGSTANESIDSVAGREFLECGYYDVEQVGRIVRSLLLTLSTACVEKTYGDLFKSPLSVVGDVQKEMLEYLNLQSEAYASGTGVAGVASSTSPDPVEMAEEVLDNFVQSKTNIFSRVSSKLISSDRKEDKIEEFVQELDRSGAWMAGQREILAKMLLKRLDRNGTSSCEMSFQTSEELAEHKGSCPLRPITCDNEGCRHVFSALHALEHDGVCTFKLLPCEQGCEALLMRSDMDRHCITVCSMKLVNCPFFQVGCTNMLPQRMVEQHCTDSMGFHLISVAQNLQKQEISSSNINQRVLLLEKDLSISQKSEAADIGTLSLMVRQQDAKIKALEQEAKKLRKDLKAVTVSAEVLQLRRELQNLQKKIET